MYMSVRPDYFHPIKSFTNIITDITDGMDNSPEMRGNDRLLKILLVVAEN